MVQQMLGKGRDKAECMGERTLRDVAHEGAGGGERAEVDGDRSGVEADENFGGTCEGGRVHYGLHKNPHVRLYAQTWVDGDGGCCGGNSCEEVVDGRDRDMDMDLGNARVRGYGSRRHGRVEEMADNRWDPGGDSLSVG